MKPEQKHIAEMERLKEAIKNTNSEYLKRDYSKKLKKMKSELVEYRYWKSKTV